jgi:hypothetical protein
MPELSRFHGIIIRMFAEPSAGLTSPIFTLMAKSMPQFLPFVRWQLSPALCRSLSKDWLKRELNCTRVSLKPIGSN